MSRLPEGWASESEDAPNATVASLRELGVSEAKGTLRVEHDGDDCTVVSLCPVCFVDHRAIELPLVVNLRAGQPWCYRCANGCQESLIWDAMDLLAHRAARGTVRSLPLDALPTRARDFAHAVSVATQTPPELAVFAVLGTAATACLGAAQVAVPWGTSPLALFSMVVLPSGERKSAVLAMVAGPLRRAQRELREEARPKIAAIVARRETLEAQRRQAINQGERERAEELSAEIALLPPAIEPRVLVDDVTPERLGSLIADHGAIGVVAAESAFLDNIVKGRYSDGAGNLHLVCQAYMGEETSIDRQGAESRLLPEPLLVLSLCVQPHVLEALAGDRNARGQGLIGRTMFARPASIVGFREINPPTVPPDLDAWWHGTVRRLFAMRDKARLTIAMDGPAAQAFRDMQGEHERRMRPAGDLSAIPDWAGRHPDRVARIAALLCLLDSGSRISEAHMDGALRIGEYLIDEAVAILGDASRPAMATPLKPYEKAERFIRQLLAPGPMAARDVYSAANEQGISQRTLERATSPGGTVEKVRGPNGWTWALRDSGGVGGVAEWRSGGHGADTTPPHRHTATPPMAPRARRSSGDDQIALWNGTAVSADEVAA